MLPTATWPNLSLGVAFPTGPGCVCIHEPELSVPLSEEGVGHVLRGALEAEYLVGIVVVLKPVGNLVGVRWPNLSHENSKPGFSTTPGS